MNVQQWITNHPHEVVTVPLNASVKEAINLMLKEACARDVYVVDEQGEITGHLSHIRLARIILEKHRPVHTRRQLMERAFGGKINEYMNPEITYARLHEPMDEVISRQLSNQLEDMPVIDENNHPVGSINLSELLRVWRDNGENNPVK